MIDNPTPVDADRTFQALLPALVSRGRPIALVGMMGAGKSTLARQLSTLLGLSTFEIDYEIEKRMCMSIPECFANKGEGAFRKAEQETIADFMRRGAAVLSLGGGAFINPALRELLLQQADCLYLNVPREELWGRVKTRLHKRPMLAGDNPRGKFDALYDQRSPIYALAPIHLNGSDESAVDTALRAKDALWNHLKAHMS